MSSIFPPLWNLTGQQERLLGFLFASGHPSKSQMMDELYGDAILQPEIKIIDVLVCKIRKKLKPFGIEISTHWGRGYYLSEPNKDQIRAHLAMQPITKEQAEDATRRAT
jgi:two-component system cell cycle response regulator CtrA